MPMDSQQLNLTENIHYSKCILYFTSVAEKKNLQKWNIKSEIYYLKEYKNSLG